MKKITWDTENITKLRDLAESDFDAHQIAEKMDTTHTAICTQLSRFKIRARRKSGWTNEQIEQLKIMTNNKISSLEISKVIGKTVRAVEAKKHYLNIRILDKWTDDQIDFYKKARSDGQSCKDISDILGKKLSSVYGLNRKKLEGSIFSYRKWNNKDELLLKDLISSGKNLNEISIIMTRTREAVANKLRDFNFKIPAGPTSNKDVFLDHYQEIHKFPRILRNRLLSIRRGASKRNIKYSISLDDLKHTWDRQMGLCFYTGLKMGVSGRKYGFSIDRINSERGYEADNIVMCCYIVNTMKNISNGDEFINICKLIYEKSLK